MKIPPCKKSPDGKHHWRYSARKHSNKYLRFVECACGQKAQETRDGIKFTTARQFEGGKSKIEHYRMNEIRRAKFDRFGMTFTEFVDYALDKL